MDFTYIIDFVVTLLIYRAQLKLNFQSCLINFIIIYHFDVIKTNLLENCMTNLTNVYIKINTDETKEIEAKIDADIANGNKNYATL